MRAGSWQRTEWGSNAAKETGEDFLWAAAFELSPEGDWILEVEEGENLLGGRNNEMPAHLLTPLCSLVPAQPSLFLPSHSPVLGSPQVQFPKMSLPGAWWLVPSPASCRPHLAPGSCYDALGSQTLHFVASLGPTSLH